MIMLMFGLMRLATGVVAALCGTLWGMSAWLGRTLWGMSILGHPALFGRRGAAGDRPAAEALRGTVTFYNGLKGHGWVAADGGGRMLLVRLGDVVDPGPWLRHGARVAFEIDPGDAARCLRVTMTEPPPAGRAVVPSAAELDRLMATDDRTLADMWLAVFSETVGPRPGKTIPGAILNRDSGAMETVQVAPRWAIGSMGLTRRQMIDRVASGLAGGLPPHWSPEVGDEVEMWSRYTEKWFPAVVDARSPSRGGGWPLLTVRIKGNAAADTGVAKSEIRPLDGAARLAAARREYPAAFYDLYDDDNIRHMRECGGCPDCEGLGEYYRECGDARCGMHHRDEACIMGRMA